MTVYVSDKFHLRKDAIVRVTTFYPTTVITNIGNDVAKVLKSNDGMNWILLTTVSPNQTSTVILDKNYPFITLKEETTLYFKSTSPNHYRENTTQGTAKAVNQLSGQVNSMLSTKADKATVDNQIATLSKSLIENTANDEEALQEVADKLTALMQADKGLVSAVSSQEFTDEEQQTARNNIQAISKEETISIINSGIGIYVDTELNSIRQQHKESHELFNNLSAFVNQINQRTQHADDFTILTEPTSLDTLTTQGKYFIRASSNPNAPTTHWIYVIVLKPSEDRITQFVWADNNPSLFYMRNYANSWRDWHKYVTATELNQVKQTLANIKVGGRNLLLESNIARENSEYPTYRYPLVPEHNLQEGDEVVITLWGQLAENKTFFYAYNSGGMVQIGKMDKVNEGVYQIKGRWKITRPDGLAPANNTFLAIYPFNRADVGISRIDRIKLEKGNIGTDYSPAPEDLQLKISELTERVTLLESK